MKATTLTVLAAAALFAFAPRAAAEVAGGPPAPQEKTPEQLIEQLRSDDFDQRRDAASRLEKLGDAARGVLERAAKDDDPDVRASAVKILARLSKAALQLHVVDSEGKPVANAAGEITFGASNQSRIAQLPNAPAADENVKPIPLKTNADGVASLKLESFGQIRFHVKITGYGDDLGEGMVDARSGENISLVTVKRGATVQGVVVGADGKPLKDAQVAVYSSAALKPEMLELQLLNVERSGMSGKDAVTGQDGKWRIENLSEGVHVVCVKKAEGHSPALGALFRVREGDVKDIPQIALAERKAGKLQITLKSANGKPMAKTNVSIALTPALDEKARKLSPMLQNVVYRQEEKETDESGVAEVDDLTPGKYQLQVVGQSDGLVQGATLIDAVVEIKPGETAQPEAKPVARNGSIKGRILAEDGKGIKDMSVLLLSEREVVQYMHGAVPGGAGMIFNNFNQGIPREPGVTDSKGVYRFENTPPGKYAVVFSTGEDENAAQAGYVFGVEVKPDARTEAPDAVLKGNFAIGTPTAITGRVLTAGGGPLAGAEVHFAAGGTTTTTSSEEDGGFSINQTRARAHDATARQYLFIRHAGHKPMAVQAPFEPHKDYRLEKQEYGALRITVTDEAGKPLSGVSIVPVAGAPMAQLDDAQAAPQPLKGVTNSKGYVRMTGLAAGKRELTVQAQGYFLPPKGGEADVAPNDERELKLVLCAGYRISGRVQMPQGAAVKGVIVTMDYLRSVMAGADGAFAFDGVGPGEHYLSASGAGLAMKHAVALTLPHDPQKYKAEPAPIELAHAGGIAVDCGKDFAGYAATLRPVGAIEERDDRANTNIAAGEVDADGRAEFSDIAPGQYTVSLSSHDFDFAVVSERTAAEALAGPFEVKPIESHAALAALPAVKAEFAKGNGSVSARVLIAGQRLMTTEQSSVTVALKILGERAIASTALNDSMDTLLQAPAAPLIVGTPPAEGFKVRVPGGIEVESLPAGAYKIFAALNYYNYTEEGDENESQHSGKYKQIGTFTIKDGEKLELGELKFEPDDVPENVKPAEILKNMLRPIDKAQDFEP